MRAMRIVRAKIERRVDCTQEKPVSIGSADKIGVFSDPAEACCFGEGLFHDRRGVYEDLEIAAPAFALAFDQPAPERLQRALYYVMIIGALGVDRDPTDITIVGKRQRIQGGSVAHTKCDHRT